MWVGRGLVDGGGEVTRVVSVWTVVVDCMSGCFGSIRDTRMPMRRWKERRKEHTLKACSPGLFVAETRGWAIMALDEQHSHKATACGSWDI